MRRLPLPADRTPIILLLLLAFWLRIYRLGDKAVWWDEGWSVWVARHDLIGILQKTGTDVHPPFYFTLLHLWRGFSGDGEFGLRFLSALLGTLAIPVIFLLGKRIGGRQVGLLAAIVLTVSRFNVAWSQEIRMYALASLLALLGVWAAIQVWERGRWYDYAGYVLCIAAGLYSLYLFFPIPLAINAGWLWLAWQTRERKREWRRWLAAQLAVLALLAPWLGYALRGFLTTSSATPIAPWEFLKIYWTVLTVGIPLNVNVFAPYSVPVLVLFGLGVAALIIAARHSYRQARDLTILLTGLLMPVAIVYYIAMPKVGTYAPPFDPRYLVIFSGYFAILLAWGIVALGRQFFPPRWRTFGLLLVTIPLYAAMIGLRDYHPGRVLLDDYKSLARTLAGREQPGDAVVLFSDTDWPIWAYHYPGSWRGVPHAWQMTPQLAQDFLAPIWESHGGVWLVVTPYAAVGDLQGYLPAWLAERATAVSVQPYGDKALHFYARTPERAAQQTAVNPSIPPQFSLDLDLGAARLQGYDLAVRDLRSGDEVHLALYWQHTGQAAAVRVGILDGEGRAIVWQETAVPGTTGSLSRQEFTFTLPPDAAGGVYHFFVRSGAGAESAFGRLNVRPRFGAALSLAEVTIPTPLQADFGDNVRLLGYDLRADEVRPGGVLYLTLYWQAQAPIEQRYKVFTHFLGETYNADSGNFLWGQQDNEPVNFSRPTPSWRMGEVIIDPYAIAIPANAPAGRYQVQIGLYEPVSGARLPLLGVDGITPAGDHLTLTTLHLP